MARASTFGRLMALAMALGLAGCAINEISMAPDARRAPREIRIGAADMVIEPVAADVAPEEVMAAVQYEVQTEPLCFSWPGLWLDASERRNIYLARYDLMTRDWGADVSDAGRERMSEYVELGFLSARDRPDIGAGAVEYTLTAEGAAALRGSPYGGDRPSFCAPSQRRVVEIISMEWGRYPCGTLLVRFTHIADDWPTWARTANARNRVASTWAPVGVEAAGSVSMSRQWFHPNRVPDDWSSNGELRSVCYDDARQVVTGDDLELRVQD